ncbi:MAG: ABC transporter permease [Bacteroidota bacterium]
MSPLALTIAALRRRPWGTTLNVLLLALGVGSIVALLLVGGQLDRALSRDAEGIDLVVGAKGSPLQLVLSGVYHADAPTGNVPEAEVESLLGDNPAIASWIPLALGDSYQGRRVVGTTAEFAALYGAEPDDGRLWESVGEATLGAAVAAETGLEIGDELVTSHGLTAGGEAHDDEPLRVVGVLSPTGRVLDRLVLTSVETIRAVHGDHDHEDGDHDHEDGEHDHDADHEGDGHSDEEDHDHGDEDHDHSDGDHDHSDDDHNDESAPDNVALLDGATSPESEEAGPPAGGADAPPGFGFPGLPAPDAAAPDEEEDSGPEITAALVRYASPLAAVSFPRFVNAETNLQAASPALEAQRLLGLLGVGLGALRAFGFILVVASLLGVAIGLYNAMRERRTDLAVMRTLGATRKRLVAQVLLEGVLLTGAGALLGVLLGHGAVALLAAAAAETRSPLPVTAWTVAPAEVALVVLALVVGALVALVPAIQVYRADVAETLARS